MSGIEANEEMCAYWVERSAALATALMPHIGYARAAELSKQSVKEGVLIRDLVKREQVLPPDQIDDVLDLRKMTEIGVPGGTHGMVGGRLRLIPTVRIGLDSTACESPLGPNTASSARFTWPVASTRGR